MNHYLFLFTLSPVQSFIAQARKTQDLYTGSYILSALIKAGVDEFDEESVIFPNAKFLKDNENASAPNRFIALWKGEESSLQVKGEEVEKRVRKHFMETANGALGRVEKPKGFDQQIEQHLSIYWAFQPIANEDYKTAYQNLENEIASIKNVRTFEQFNYKGSLGEQGRKCNLDGERNVLFYKERIVRGKKIAPLFVDKTNTEKDNRDRLDYGEGLSAIGYMKRFYKWKGVDSFPSTAQVALFNDLNKLNSEQKEYLQCLKDLISSRKILNACTKIQEKGLENKIDISDKKDWITHFDYQACFEENLTKNNYPNDNQLNYIRLVQEKLQPDLQDKYYALVMFDGDKMGKKLGELASKGIEVHSDFSQRLMQFAKLARTYVDKNDKGRTVYTGGDDFLGFINLHYLFDVMSYLRDAFEREIGHDLTFSAGIVIAHYKIPLSEVLKMTRSVEKAAKNEGSRNSFCLTTIKHSGEIQKTVIKWGKNNEYWKALAYIIEKVSPKENKEAAFSTKFIQSLTFELHQLGGVENDFSNDAIVKTEIKRLIERSKNPETSPSEVSELSSKVYKLWRAFYEREDAANRVENFVHALHIADFISRKTRK